MISQSFPTSSNSIYLAISNIWTLVFNTSVCLWSYSVWSTSHLYLSLSSFGSKFPNFWSYLLLLIHAFPSASWQSETCFQLFHYIKKITELQFPTFGIKRYNHGAYWVSIMAGKTARRNSWAVLRVRISVLFSFPLPPHKVEGSVDTHTSRA